MILTNKIAHKAISFISSNISKSEEDLEKIEYGIKVLVSNFFKLILLFSTAYFLGIFKYTLLAFVIFGIIRSFACGVHANSTIQCIFLNYLLFFGNVYLSLYHPLRNTILMIIFIISFILLCLYSPADTAERPLINKNFRKLLKFASVGVSVILFIICLFIDNSVYRTIIIFSILEESLVITPFLYKILGKSYRNYDKIDL